ncbi:MAG: helix-turn-helix domain-containing protein [Fluviibacter phosphoraccumulans]
MLNEVKRLLQDRRVDKVMEATGLSRDTISDIRDGRNSNPTMATLQKLYDYLNERSVKRND